MVQNIFKHLRNCEGGAPLKTSEVFDEQTSTQIHVGHFIVFLTTCTLFVEFMI